MSPSHHLNRARRYLKFAGGNTAVGDYDRAAKALARSASHAATAVAVHWHLLTGSRRRLQSALNDQAHKGNISYSQAGVLRQTYALPDRIADAPSDDANAVPRLLKRTGTRVRRLLRCIVAAMADNPSPPTFAEILARIAAEPDPPGAQRIRIYDPPAPQPS